MEITKEQAKDFAKNSLPSVSGFHPDVIELMRQFAQEMSDKAVEEYKESIKPEYKNCTKCKHDFIIYDSDDRDSELCILCRN